MKDMGLVHVWGEGCNIGGPVAVLLTNDNHTHFLGAYIDDKKGEKLVLELLPKTAISPNTGWQRGAPYSERLLRHVAMLDAVAGKGWGITTEGPTQIDPPEEKPVRVFGSGAKKPAVSSPEVAAVKADLDALMGKYKQVVE